MSARVRPFVGALLAGFILLSSGCASDADDSPAVADWQRHVERYVWDQGNGDPSVLRDLSWDEYHHGFAVYSDPLPDRSEDLFGLRVGEFSIRNRPTFVFLLARVDRNELRDLWPVAMQMDQGRFIWWDGPSNAGAMHAYQQSPPIPTTSDAGAAFPKMGATFHAAAGPSEIRVVHDESSAAWIIPLPAGPPAGPAQTQPWH